VGLAILLGVFGAGVLIGAPVAFAMGIAAAAAFWFEGFPMLITFQRATAGVSVFSLLAIPFFVFAGEIMLHGGIAKRLVRLASALVGHFRGGLAMVNIGVSLFFAEISGSAVADVAAMGSILIPQMKKRGYSKEFSAAVTSSSASLAIIIPPSIPMILYAASANTSVEQLFVAGVVPGLLGAAGLMGVAYIFARRYKLPTEEAFNMPRMRETFMDALPAFGLPVIILGGILGGVVTPTEAASIAVAYAVFIGTFVYRTLTIRSFYQMLVRTARITGVIFVIIAFAGILGWWMSFERIPQLIAETVLGLSDNRYGVIAIIIGLLLIVGMVMDITAILIILAPVLVPLTEQVGLEPIHAGIIFVLALNISLMTPPVGACLFVLSSVTGEKLERISIKLFPFLIAEITILFAFAFWEDAALWLPRMLGFAE